MGIGGLTLKAHNFNDWSDLIGVWSYNSSGASTTGRNAHLASNGPIWLDHAGVGGNIYHTSGGTVTYDNGSGITGSVNDEPTQTCPPIVVPTI